MTDRQPTILHVDDDEANRYAVTRSLVKAGYTVTEAADGATALRVAAGRPDLIILDVRLPDIDGFEVCRRVKADPATADIPVLHLSASFVSGQAKATGLDGGAEAYLVRPVEPVELLATVRALLRAKATEDALRASDGQHRAVLAALGEGVLVLDAAGVIVLANASAERIIGLSADQLRGRDSVDPQWRAVGEDGADLPAPAHPLRVALRDGRQVADQVVGIHRPDGTLVWTSVTAVPLTDGRTGRVTGVVGSFFDVTDRRRAAAELAASDRRQAMLLRLMRGQREATDPADMVRAAAGAIGRHLAVDRAGFAQVDGGRALTVTGRWSSAAARPGPSGPLDLASLGGGIVAQALRGENVTVDDVSADPRAVGSNLAALGTVSLAAAPIVRRGQWLAVLYVSHGSPRAWASAEVDLAREVAELTWDAVERVRAGLALRAEEERLRLILANIKDHAIFTLALDGTVIDWNVGAERVFGYPASDIVGRSIAALFTPEDRAGERPRIEMELAATGGLAEDTRHHVRRDGTTFFTSGSMEGLRDAAGQLRGFVKVVRDVTERHRMDEPRQALHDGERAARAEAERVGRIKDEFLATLSHELRTPLNAILGWATIIRGGGHDADDVVQGLEVIERNGRAQGQIIEDLLDMSRIISGKVRLDVQRVDLVAVVTAAVETARPSAEAKGVRLHSVVDPLAGVHVSGDAGRLQQVMWNLLTNAVKFTPRGGRVQVLLARAESHVELTVSDTGEGIGPDFLPHVFDRFRQADASTTRRHGGLGLGLSIVKQLVELHGGAIGATSGGPGLGTTFVLSLPLAALQPDADAPRPHAHAGPSPDAALATATAAPTDLSGIRVLVVDDERDARVMVQRLLRDRGAVVTTTGSVGEAVRLVGTAAFDVLVSDVGMPDEDGYTLIRRVRALGAAGGGEISSIALTAYARVEDRVRAVSAGFQMRLAKPIEPVELVAMVAAVAGRPGVS